MAGSSDFFRTLLGVAVVGLRSQRFASASTSFGERSAMRCVTRPPPTVFVASRPSLWLHPGQDEAEVDPVGALGWRAANCRRRTIDT